MSKLPGGKARPKVMPELVVNVVYSTPESGEVHGVAICAMAPLRTVVIWSARASRQSCLRTVGNEILRMEKTKENLREEAPRSVAAVAAVKDLMATKKEGREMKGRRARADEQKLGQNHRGGEAGTRCHYKADGERRSLPKSRARAAESPLVRIGKPPSP